MQWASARLGAVEFTGVGFIVDIDVPVDAATAGTLDISGGDARISAAHTEYGAGCVLFVRSGRLSALEVHGYDGEWPEDANVLAIADVVPILVQSDAITA